MQNLYQNIEDDKIFLRVIDYNFVFYILEDSRITVRKHLGGFVDTIVDEEFNLKDLKEDGKYLILINDYTPKKNRYDLNKDCTVFTLTGEPGQTIELEGPKVFTYTPVQEISVNRLREMADAEKKIDEKKAVPRYPTKKQ